jgi:hypothetical protein
MSSSDPARLTVRPEHKAVEISVLDSEFGVVAEGAGELSVDLAPGIYELQLRLGPSQEQRLIKLEAGQPHEEHPELAIPEGRAQTDEVQLAVPSAAPLDGTSTMREDHLRAAVEASSTLAASREPSGIVLMVRSLRDEAPFTPALARALSLVDADGRPVNVAQSTGQNWTTLVAPLQPGGYALRHTSPAGATFQPIWAAAGWQTLVFVARTEAGLAPDRAAVHMTRMHDPWQLNTPDPDDNRRDVDLAVEAARWSLRQGRPSISSELLGLLLRSKFRNPMLGIIGAHAMLLNAHPDLRALQTVISNLSNLVHGHPDVQALTWLLEDARDEGHANRAKDRISWPPMLLASYAAAIERDADEPGLLAQGSPAETLAQNLLVTGIWTTWRLPSETTHRRRGVTPGAAESHKTDTAIARVLEYIDALAARRDQPRDSLIEKVDIRRCAIGTGLPSAVVARALATLRRTHG